MNTAIRAATQLNIEFERIKREASRRRAQSGPTWQTAQQVADWFEREKRLLDHVNIVVAATDEDGVEIEIEETQKDLEIERILDQARTRSGANSAGHPLELTAEEQLKLKALETGKPPEIDLSVSAAYEVYLEQHLRGREDKAAKVSVDQFIEFAGDVELKSITRRTVTKWFGHLSDVRRQAPGTLRKRLTMMKAIYNYVLDQELVSGSNPFARAKMSKDMEGAVNERLPFHTVHLEAIDRYLATSKVQDETRHVVSLLKHTGCRPSEIGGLRAEDIILTGDVPFIVVRWTDERRLKTQQSTRRIPLIGEGLEAARAARLARPQGWLFPSLAPTSNEANDNPNMSARIRGVIRRAGVHNSPKLVPYSFRHTVAAALDQSPGLTQIIRDRVLGRGKPDKYGAREQPLEVSRDALEKAIERLGAVDEYLYSREELTITPPET
jgi:integrase